MTRNPGLCFVIADGEHARFVEADANNVLRTTRSIDSVSAHVASRDLVSDRPGRSFESASPTSHGVAPRHDPHQMEKTKFAHFIADTVSAAAGEGAFDRLVLVAPSHCLREIEDRLDAPTAAMVTGTLVKDLVKTPDYELAPHLREWIGPPGRAPL